MLGPSSDGDEERTSPLRQTLDHLREGLQILGPDWRYLYVNDAVARHGRRRPEELLGRTVLECYPGIESTELFGILQRCMRERSGADYSTEFTFDDGLKAWFELRIQPCPEGLAVLSLDVTERRRLEASAHQAEKLRALGQLAAGVAHDLRNMLHPLYLQLELLRRRIPAGVAAQDILDQMASVLQRGTETVDLLRNLARVEPVEEGLPVDLGAVAREAVALCRDRAAEGTVAVVLDVQLDEAVPPARASAPAVLSAVVNLLVNALEAMPGGGHVTVRTGAGAEGPWISVADDGPGMPPEVQARAFEPFFTTKGLTGTGLGLAMVQAVVARHGGAVHLSTAPGHGTTVVLSFPPA